MIKKWQENSHVLSCNQLWHQSYVVHQATAKNSLLANFRIVDSFILIGAVALFTKKHAAAFFEHGRNELHVHVHVQYRMV